MERPGSRSAIVVAFALPPSLEATRQGHVDNARLGVPAHVTLLFPFVPAPQLQEPDAALAAAIVRRTPAFQVEFRDVASFDPGPTKYGVVWLAPEPSEPFIEMTNALAAAFPDRKPYEGLHDTVIPHLTLANVDLDVPALVAAARRALPFQRRVAAAALLVEDDAGQWRIDRELPLG